MHITYRDVSHFQPNYQPTWHTAMKVTQGVGYVDPEWKQIAARCDAKGFEWIGYHFLEHQSISAQVTNLVRQIGTGRSCMLDVERVDLSGVHHPELDATHADVLDFMDEYAARTSGIVSLVYLPQWYWAGIYGHPTLTPIANRGGVLISSNPYGPYSDTAPGWNEYHTTQHGITFHAGIAPTIWQYTDAGGVPPADTNAFKGTEAQLLALWNGGNTHPDNPVEVPDMDASQDRKLTDVWSYLAALGANKSGNQPYGDTDGTTALVAYATKDDLARVEAKIDALATGGIDYAALAKAVNDDAAQRLAN